MTLIDNTIADLRAALEKKEKQLAQLKAMPPNVPKDMYYGWHVLCGKIEREIMGIEDDIREAERVKDLDPPALFLGEDGTLDERDLEQARFQR